MTLQVVWSTTQVLLLPLASASRPQCSLTSGCTPWVTGGYLELHGTYFRWILSGSARQQRGGEQELAPFAMCMPLCARCLDGAAHEVRTAGAVVEPADHRCLASPSGPTAELGGLWTPWRSSRVRM